MSANASDLQKIFAVFLLLALLALFSVMVSGFFGALVFAAAGALMFYPLQVYFEERMAPTRAAALNLLLLLLVVVVPATILFGMAGAQALSVADQASSWIGARLNADAPFANLRLPDWFPFAVEFETIKNEITSKAGQIAGATGRFLVRTLSQVTQATALFLLDVFVAAYFFFYCLLNGQRLTRDIVHSLPLDQEGRDDLVHISAAVTRSVLKSMVIIGAVQGLLSGFAFWLVGIDAYVFWGVVMGFLSVIPFVGPIVIWLPVAVYFGLSGEYWQVVFLAVWFWVVVASVDNVLRPILIGSDTQMPDVLVLLTTLGGLFTFGAIGLVLGPLIGALLMAAWEVYRRSFAAELAHDPAAFTGPDEARAPAVAGSVSDSSNAS